MDTSAHPSNKDNQQSAFRGTFFYLQFVIVVAFVVATLFTAWTPASLLPGDLTNRLASAIGPAGQTPLPDYPTATPRPRPVIGLVVGHWGDDNDPGAVCGDDLNNLTEFEVNQGVATKVMENLIDQGFDVELLKEFDPRLVGFRALALVSIHADSCNYVNDLATGYKLAATVNNPRPEKTARLLACMRDRYGEATNMDYHANSVTNDMSSYHAFNEIHSDTPAVIIEVGFMNLDYQILTQGQDQIAEGITEGLLCYVHNENVSKEETE